MQLFYRIAIEQEKLAIFLNVDNIILLPLGMVEGEVVAVVATEHVLHGCRRVCQEYVLVAGEQLTSSSPKPQSIYFTANFQQKAKSWGLSEKDALDVLYHGEEIKPGIKTRKYNGYALSIYYGQSKTTGQPYISTIWKRSRR